MEKNKTPEKVQYAGQKKALSISMILLIAGCFIFPFYYETTTIWYKFGLDKIMLQTGQICGLLAFVFLCTQIVLALRSRAIDGILGPGNRTRFHRINGFIVGTLLLAHALLILIPEGFNNLPVGLKFWPEMVGSFTLFTIILTVVVSQFKEHLHLNHKLWRAVHKPTGYLIFLASTVHIRFVSDAFEQLVPQIILFTLATNLVLWVLFIKISSVQKQNKR